MSEVFVKKCTCGWIGFGGSEAETKQLFEDHDFYTTLFGEHQSRGYMFIAPLPANMVDYLRG